MAVRFRNVTTSTDAPVATWPTEAVRAALERGDLQEWRRVAAELRRDPWGRTARQVEEVLRSSRPYGVAELMEDVLRRSRAEREAAERAAVAEQVRRLIAASGLTRAAFASRVGTSQSRLSTYATGKVTPSAALLLRMRRVAGESGRAEAAEPEREQRA